ncbi:MAG: serine hydrolase domain-containing protein, partial [Pseudomonadota bacterium]
FLWTGVMMAVERGEIDLDADVNSYLRRYRLPDTHGPLTMNDLMAHRVGLEDAYKIFLPEIGALPLPEALSASEPKKVFEASGPTADSNWATTLAAAVLEDATGRDYADILYNDLLLPLGMRDTALDGTSPVAKRVPVSRSYTPTAKGLKDDGQIELGAFSSIGGMTSTAADMAKWVSMHLNEGSFNGVRILSPESYALMRERAFNDRPSSGDMAHGMMDRVFRGYRVYGHGGSINSFLSDMSIAPELGLGIFISQNTESARAIGAVTRLLIDRAIEERQGAPLFDRIIAPKDDEDEGAGNDAAVKNAEEVAGSYLSNRRAYKGFEKVFAIDAVTTFVASGENLYAEGSKHNPMRRLAPDLYEDRFGYRTTFIRNDAGKVVRFAGSSGSSTSERIGKTDGPAGLTYALGALAALIATTWLGLWRRFGRPDETTIAGRALSLIVLVSTVPAIVFAIVLGQFLEKVSNLSYAGIFSDYPPSNMEMVIFLGSLTAVAGLVAFVSVVPAWTASGWSIFRKVHHSAFGIVYLAAGFMLWRWGLAFSSTMVG